MKLIQQTIMVTIIIHYCSRLGVVARSDARPPVACSILTSGNILSWRLVMK